MMSTKLSNKDSKSGISAGQRKMLRLPKPSELFDLRYYLISTTQQWPLFMLFSIVFFFAIPGVILFGTTEGNYASSWTFENASFFKLRGGRITLHQQEQPLRQLLLQQEPQQPLQLPHAPCG